MAINKQHKFAKDLQGLATFHKVLSHPARLAILDILAKYEIASESQLYKVQRDHHLTLYPAIHLLNNVCVK